MSFIFQSKKMSLYNGFLNHAEQQKYYNLIKSLVLVLEKRVLRFYQQRPCNEDKFISIICKIVNKLSKMEQSKYIQPKFSDSLEQLLKELRVENSTRLQRFNTESQLTLNFDDRCSQVSFDFQMNSASKKKVSSPNSFKLESIDTYRLKDQKKYRSFENVRMKSIIDEREELAKHKVGKNRSGDVKNIKLRVQPPRLGHFIDRINKDSMMDQYPRGSKQRKRSEENYLGQKRFKDKRIVRTITNH